MPYKTIDTLPDKVRHVLPKHAQEIYMKAFNNAIREYENPDKRRDPSESPEIIAHKVAWNAVKEKYQKEQDSDQWTEK